MSAAREEEMTVKIPLKEQESPTSPTSQKTEERPKLWGIEIRFLVLPLLAVQNAGAVLLMRATRSIPGQNLFVSQTAVIMQELAKGLACILILLATEGGVGSAWAQPTEALKTGVPAFLYLIQNNFQYIAAGLLDVVTYTITGQTKILWTGILTVTLLQRPLQCNKWTGLLILCIGVCLVNLGTSANSEKQAERVSPEQRMVGTVVLLVAACCSSLAGVYFEKILKGVQISLWARNLQLAFYSVVIGCGVLYTTKKDFEKVLTLGFFHGYTPLTWCAVMMNAFGGLLVGTVIKYADAVLKDVSIGASICLSAIGSIFLFEYELSVMVIIGAAFVSYAIFVYSGNTANHLWLLVTSVTGSDSSSPQAEKRGAQNA
ncbi:UDP-galactose/UDP-N-acetylglucosamine transporter srf-3 [Diplonema papillatum]|nr:UDP-galactose/UDP-N-acetylglucosamine transporter srf-3 [Diplonema papillatum]